MTPVRLRRRQSTFAAVRAHVYRRYRAKGYGRRRAAYIADATAGQVVRRRRSRRGR